MSEKTILLAQNCGHYSSRCASNTWKIFKKPLKYCLISITCLLLIKTLIIPTINLVNGFSGYAHATHIKLE